MRYLSTYSQYPQRKKKNQKERNRYYYYFNLLNPEGTDHVLLTGDILTSYQHFKISRLDYIMFMCYIDNANI